MNFKYQYLFLPRMDESSLYVRAKIFFVAALMCLSTAYLAAQTVCAGVVRPTLQANSVTNICPETTVNLNNQLAVPIPTGLTLVWYKNALRTGAVYATPTAATNGIYYAFFKDAALNCFTAASEPLNVVTDMCSGCTNTNLVFNGSFEQGKIGFDHNFTYFPTTAVSCITDAHTGHITLLTEGDACKLHVPAFWATAADHTTASQCGKYLFVQGGENAVPANQTVWQQTVAGLIPEKKYTFSYWAHDNVMNFAVPISYPAHSASVDNLAFIRENTFPYLAEATQKNWKKFRTNFIADADGKVVLKINNGNRYNLHGNDWVLDDISLVAFCNDYDSDDVADIEDLDDDNDGITDNREGAYPSIIPYETYGTFGNLVGAARANLQMRPQDYLYSAGTTALAAGNYAIVTNNGVASLGGFKNIYGHTVGDTSDAFLAIKQSVTPTKFFSRQYRVGQMGRYRFGTFAVNAGATPFEVGVQLLNSRGDTLRSATTCPVSAFTSATFYNWVEAMDTINLATGTYTLEVFNIIKGANTAATFAIDDIYFRPDNIDLIPTLDTDKDDLANSRDLDSDGDGCADAIEGTQAFTSANLSLSTMQGGNYGVNYTGDADAIATTLCVETTCVGLQGDSLGIPRMAGLGQGFGDGQNKIINSQCPLVNCVSAPKPLLLANSVTNMCGYTTANLNYQIDTVPYGSRLVWYKDSLHTGNAFATPMAATTGIYYAFHIYSNANCISPPSEPINVVIDSCSGATNANLVFNGHFEHGKVGFDHNYKYFTTTAASCITDAHTGHITILSESDICKLHVPAFWATAADHTTSSQKGKYLFVQGGENAVPANQMVWKQTVGGLTAGKKYTFSYWAHDNVMNFAVPISYPGHSASVDDVATIRQDTFPYLAETSQKNWKKFRTNFIADADGRVDLKIFNRNRYNLHGNDWVLDDISLVAFTGDYDGDDVANIEDLDDDNDGITDNREGAYPSIIPNEVYGTFGTLTTTTRANLQTTPQYFTYSGGTTALTAGTYAVVTNNGAASLGTVGEFKNIKGHTVGDTSDAFLAVKQGSAATTLYSKKINIAQAGRYRFGAFAANAATLAGSSFTVGTQLLNNTGDVLKSATTNSIPSYTSATFYNWVEATDTINLSAGTYTLDVFTGVGTAAFAIDDIYFRPDSSDLIPTMDTDKDGLANSQDLDSDGDGCSDAVEGSASLVLANLTLSTMAAGNTGVNYTGFAGALSTTLCATTNCVGVQGDYIGIPKLAGLGQLVGDGQNKAIHSQCAIYPCAAGTPSPLMTANSVTNVCTEGSVNLTNFVSADPLPYSARLAWFKDSLHTGAELRTPIAAASGVYYPFYIYSNTNCITAASEPINVVLDSCAGSTNANLVFNGHFEHGKVGFDYNYKYFNTTATNCITDAHTGHITILSDADVCKLHVPAFWATAADHTTSSQKGKYLFVQGGENAVPANQMVWKQTVAGLTAGKKYVFSYWAHDNVMNFAVPASYPGHSATADALASIRQDTFPYLAETSQKNWKKFRTIFVADANGRVDLKIFNRNRYNLHGNDWVLDDISLVAFTGDYDSDDVANIEDLDDDNDGITDNREGAYPSIISNEAYGTFGTLTTTTRANVQTHTPYYTYSGGVLALAAGSYAVVTNNGAASLTPSGDFKQVKGHTVGDTSDAFLAVRQGSSATKFYSKSIKIAQAGRYRFGAFATNAGTIAGTTVEVGVQLLGSAGDTLRTATTGKVPSVTSATFYNWVEATDTINLAAGTYTLEVFTGAGTAYFAIDDIYFRPDSTDLIPVMDTDKDGLANSQDVDSDGDGCSDAIEGSSAIVLANLVNSTVAGGNSGANYTGEAGAMTMTLCATTACVGTQGDYLGLPNMAGLGQLVGDGQNKDINNQCILTPCASVPTPLLLANSVTNICPAPSVNLKTMLVDTIPFGARIAWTKDSVQGKSYLTPTSAASNIYYATYIYDNKNCMSPASEPINVVVDGCTGCSNTNLVFNGGFELGKIGFDNNYKFYPTTQFSCIGDAQTGHITILTDADCKLHVPAFWATAADHTTSSQRGRYLFVQGGENLMPANQMVWKQTVAGLIPGKKYTFSYWAHDNVMNFAVPASFPGHSASVDSIAVIRSETFPYLAAVTQNNWKKSRVNFIADADGKVELKISNTNRYNLHGNDWVLDDISLMAFCNDYDSDDVADVEDCDDDNDGIYDKRESAYPSMLFHEMYGTFGELKGNTRANLQATPTNYVYSSGTTPLTASTYAVVTSNGTASLSGGGDFKQVKGHTMGDTSDAFLAVKQGTMPTKLFSKRFNLNAAGKYTFGAFATNAATLAGAPFEVRVQLLGSKGDTLRTATTGQVPSFTSQTFYNWVEATDTVTLAVGAYTLEVSNVITGTTASTFAVDDIYFRPVDTDLVHVIDTDNDGIPNSRDLDSDGDGCADAIEGGGTYKAANLVNSTMSGGNAGPNYLGLPVYISTTLCATANCVSIKSDSLGVPMMVTGQGQSIGDSQNSAVNQCTTTGVDILADASWAIAPNPTNQYFTISGDINKGFKVAVYDNLGRLVISQRNETQVDVQNLANGVYMVRLETDKGMSIKKLLVLHDK